MKKIALLLAVLMLFSSILTGCTSAKPAASASASSVAATPEAASETPAATPEASAVEPEPTPRGPFTMSIAGIQIDDKAGFPAGMDEKTNVWRDFYLNEYGVTLEEKWVVPAAQADEKMNLQIATGDVPDLMKVNATQYQLLDPYGLVEKPEPCHAQNHGGPVRDGKGIQRKRPGPG